MVPKSRPKMNSETERGKADGSVCRGFRWHVSQRADESAGKMGPLVGKSVNSRTQSKTFGLERENAPESVGWARSSSDRLKANLTFDGGGAATNPALGEFVGPPADFSLPATSHSL